MPPASARPDALHEAAECGFAGSPLPVAAIDLDGARLLDLNAAAAALYGGTRAELVGRPLAELLAPPDAAGEPGADALALFVQRATEPLASAFECRHRRPDGSAWLAELRIVRLEPGPPRRLLCTLQDVSAQREDAQALHRLEQRYRLAARIGRSAAWELWPVEGRIFYDASLSRLMGYEPEDLGEQLSGWRETIPEEARAAVRAALQALVEGRSKGYSIEHPVRRKDCSIGWVHVQGERVSAPGEKPLRVVGSTVDITERKRFERDLELTQFAVDHSADAIYWVNDEGIAVRANEQAARSLGLDLQALVGRPVWSFDVDLSAERWQPLIERLQRRGTNVFEARHRRSESSILPVHETMSRNP